MLALHADGAYEAWLAAPCPAEDDAYAALLPWATPADWDRLYAWAADRRTFCVPSPSAAFRGAVRDAARQHPRRGARARPGCIYLLERQRTHPTTLRIGDLIVASVDHGAWVAVAAACAARLPEGDVPAELGGLAQRMLGMAPRPQLLEATHAYRAGAWGAAALEHRFPPSARAGRAQRPAAPDAIEAYLLAIGLVEWLGLAPAAADAVYAAAWLDERPDVEAWLGAAPPAERLAFRSYVEWVHGRAGRRAVEMQELWDEVVHTAGRADAPRNLHRRLVGHALVCGDALLVRSEDPLAIPRALDEVANDVVLLHGWDPCGGVAVEPAGSDVVLRSAAFGPRDLQLLLRSGATRPDAGAVLAAVLAEPAERPLAVGGDGVQLAAGDPPVLAYDYGGEGWPGEPEAPPPRWRRAARLAAAMRPYERASDDRSDNRASVRVARRYLEWSWSIPALAAAIARQGGVRTAAAPAALLAAGDAAAHALAAGWCRLARHWPIAGLAGHTEAFRPVLRAGADVAAALAEASGRPGPAWLADAAAALAEREDPQAGLDTEEGACAYFWAITVLPPRRAADLVLGIHVDFPRAAYTPPRREPLDLPPWEAFCAELAATSGLDRGPPAQPDGGLTFAARARNQAYEVCLWSSHAMRRRLACDPCIPTPAERVWVPDLLKP